MASRTTLFAASVIWIGLCAAGAALAQDTVHLRPSFRAEFLPPGTEIVILSKDAGPIRDGRVQPEFIPVDRYPRQRFAGMQKDRLGSGGRSEKTIEPSPKARRLYFLYALTPDSTVYWSYSAKRDSLKFDVVSTGVMSVAPVTSPAARRDVLETFFQPRVIVHMPEDGAIDDSIFTDVDSIEVAEPVVESAPDTLRAQVVPAAPALPASPLPKRGVPSGLTVLGLILILGSGLLAWRYHREMQRLRRENLSLRARLISHERDRTSLHEMPS